MVAHNFLSAPEQLARAITIIFGIVVIITCIIQNLFRKYDAFHLPLVKYTTLWDVKTLAPTIQFCLQDLNGKTLDVVLNVNTSLGGPRQNTSSLNKFVNNLSNKDQSCFVFDGDKYPEYYTEEAPIFGFFVSPIGNFSNDLDGVIRVTVFEDSNINDSEPMNRFTVPLGYQYHLQYTEIRNHNLIEPTFSRSFKFLPILNLGTKSPSGFTKFYVQEYKTTITERREYLSYTNWDFLSALGGLLFILSIIYCLLFGSFRIDPWGYVTRVVFWKQQRGFYSRMAKSGMRIELPFLEDSEKMFERKSFEGEILALRKRVLALERMLKNYVIITDVVDQMYETNE